MDLDPEEEDLMPLQAALQSTMTVVKEFRLGTTFLGDAGADALAETVRDRISLRELELCSCDTGSDGAASLGEALRANTSQ
jgi:Ran GTPase-activating protein (RanGAP) involved in mRNA processing and transport